MPNRSYSAGNQFRYGFNGQENSNEVSNNSTTAEFWQYDSKTGRRSNLDPLLKYSESSYSTFGNNPIVMVDPSGADWYKNKETGEVEYKAKWHRKHKGYESLGKGNGDVLVYDGKEYNRKTGEVTSIMEKVVVTAKVKKDKSLMARAFPQLNEITPKKIKEWESRPKPQYYDPNPLKTIFWDATVGAFNPVKDVDIYASASVKQKIQINKSLSGTLVWMGVQGGVTSKDGQGIYGSLILQDNSYVSIKLDDETEIRGIPLRGLSPRLSFFDKPKYGDYSPQLRVIGDIVTYRNVKVQAELALDDNIAIGLRGKVESPSVLGWSVEGVVGIRTSLQAPPIFQALKDAIIK